MQHKHVSFAEKNERRKKYRDASDRGRKAREMRREFGGTFGNAQTNPLNYTLMVTGTSKDGDVRRDREGNWS
jgi:hypothetical protein